MYFYVELKYNKSKLQIFCFKCVLTASRISALVKNLYYYIPYSLIGDYLSKKSMHVKEQCLSMK